MARKRDLLAEIAVLATLQMMGNQTMAQPECDMLRIAEQYIAKQFPTFNSAGMTLVVSENGNLWQMTYKLPPWMIGGAPFITIDKRTCTIVQARIEQ